MTDEKKCPEGQHWCDETQKCVSSPGRGLKRGKQDGKQNQVGPMEGLIEKYLMNESKGDLEGLVDNFVRLIMGDQGVALTFLKTHANNLDMDFSQLDSKEYNTAYRNIYNVVLKSLRKELNKI